MLYTPLIQINVECSRVNYNTNRKLENRIREKIHNNEAVGKHE
jgi:hypothetical protein